MKKITSLLFIAGAGLLTLAGTACRKYETEPKEFLNIGLVFDSTDLNANLASQDLNSIYTNLPDGFDRIGGDFLDDGTGDAIPSRINTPVSNYYRGTVSVTNNPDQYWGNSYYAIRKANIFLKNINRVPNANAGTVLNKRYWKAEARWLRAFYYWELLKRYGGVPLLGDTLLDLNSNVRLPRNTFTQTVDYIVSECNAVKDSLRADPLASGDFGRVSKAASVALKMRVLLYAASPLFNGGGFESDATTKALTGYPSFDATRWQRVIDAYTEFTALGYYNLVTSGTPTAFTSVFLNRQTTEMIFSRQIPGNFSLEISQSPVGFVVANTRSLGYTSPTQNFVDSFPMLSGLSINATGSGYNANNPYLNRDPRLAATVFFNGARWLNDTVRTFEGGKDKPNNTAIAPIQTRTGYYLRKFLGNFANTASYATNQTRNFPYFRYAEIVLNYAEALNEVGRVEDAVTQIIRLRARAGIAAGTPARYGIKANINQAEMRSFIQNERRIELAFEEHRFWDIRRWKIAPQVLGNVTLNGVVITNSGSTATYQTIPVANTFWFDRLYHMPIPYAELIANTNLIQNEGW